MSGMSPAQYGPQRLINNEWSGTSSGQYSPCGLIIASYEKGLYIFELAHISMQHLGDCGGVGVCVLISTYISHFLMCVQPGERSERWCQYQLANNTDFMFLQSILFCYGLWLRFIVFLQRHRNQMIGTTLKNFRKLISKELLTKNQARRTMFSLTTSAITVKATICWQMIYCLEGYENLNIIVKPESFSYASFIWRCGDCYNLPNDPEHKQTARDNDDFCCCFFSCGPQFDYSSA